MRFWWGLTMATVWGLIVAVAVAFLARTAGVAFDVAALGGAVCGLLVFAATVLRRKL